MSFLERFFGNANQKYVKSLDSVIQKINSLEADFGNLSLDEIKDKVKKLKEKLSNGASLDDVLAESFALTREAGKRTLNQRHFDCQLIGGIVLHQGKIAEMRTGEGKTLTATLPLALNALAGKGCHLVTVNDYLSRRDAVWMGQIYDALGLSVACINHDQSFIYDPNYKKEEDDKIRDELGGFLVVEDFLRPCTRKEAYSADITYGTNNEFGFDYLKDNMVYDLKSKSQRGFNFTIVDEVDSILIDEARTPLIVSAPDEESSKWYGEFSRIIPKLKKDEDFEVDEKFRAVTLTEKGIDRVESILAMGNIYDERGSKYLHHLEQALKAEILFKKEKDYVIKNGEIIIIDQFTGRMMPGRRWSGGLHQAIEAKEGVRVMPESITLASVTFQNYFRMYDKLSGMTGTAETSAEEFDKVYKLEVVVIPTNKGIVRNDLSDKVYKTEEAKFRAVVNEVKEKYKKGQPVLVGTTSIDKNEYLGALLGREGLPHKVLNAKHHEQEGEIIAQAGKKGAITIATNMAGRGVDIYLGGIPSTPEENQEVKELGGLCVIGTERHEARRIDNQLRGRAGRQGDPGETQFFVSLEDDVIRIFGGDKIKGLMDRFNIDEDTPIENGLISRSIESAQSKIEGFNFDSRKHVLDYDDVLNKQRDTIYTKRDELLEKENLRDIIIPLLSKYGYSEDDYNKKEEEVGKDNMRQIEKIAGIRAIDSIWIEHLENMESLKDSVRLRAYGQRDPLIEYKKEAYKLFKELLENCEGNMVEAIMKATINIKPPAKPEEYASPKNNAGINRNDPCPCGSGKKYKKCCGK